MTDRSAWLQRQGEYPYRSVEHALQSAYAQEERAVVKSSSCFKLGASSSRGEFWADLGPWECVAQASFVRSTARQSLSGILLAVMEMYYSRPAYADRKEAMTEAVAYAVWQEMGGYANLDYLTDVCREWSGLRRTKSEQAWEVYLNVTDRTLRNWRLGRGVYVMGAANIMDSWLNRVRAELTGVFKEAGLIP